MCSGLTKLNHLSDNSGKKRLSENEATLNFPLSDLKCTFILNSQTIASLPLCCYEWLKPLLYLHFYSVRWMHRWKNHPSSPCQVLSDAELWRGFDLIWFTCRWEREKKQRYWMLLQGNGITEDSCAPSGVNKCSKIPQHYTMSHETAFCCRHNLVRKQADIICSRGGISHCGATE